MYGPYFDLLIVVLAILAAVGLTRRFRTDVTMTIVFQVILISCGILGAFAHAFPATHKADEDFPIVDLEGLAWFALVPIGLLLPRISKIKLGEAEIELSEASKASFEITDQLADLMLIGSVR